MKLSFLICFAALFAYALGDVYMHNPRGSNNRFSTDNNDENVDNNERLFDSQSNDRGGYDNSNDNSGPAETFNQRKLKYYSSSKLYVAWTAQHSCGPNGNAKCEYILQYMCGGQTRDGGSDTRVTFDRTNPASSDASGEGMHEPWYNYYACKMRGRNRGLFIADRTLNSNNADATRQNPNGNNDNNNDGNSDRNGLECPEERDYYPYWAPSPWKDIAILTDELDRCEYFHNNSFNTNPKFMCALNPATNAPFGLAAPDSFPNNGSTATSRLRLSQYIDPNQCVTNGNQWVRWDPWFTDRVTNVQSSLTSVAANYVNKPFTNAGTFNREDCQRWQAQATAGTISSDRAAYLCRNALNNPLCISPRWSRDNHLGAVEGGFMQNFTWSIPDPENVNSFDQCVLRIRYNMSSTDFDRNIDHEFNGKENSPILQDPYVMYLWDYPLRLAIDTSQFARTFQDRSHVFTIYPRSALVGVAPSVDIHNVNVRGKRGTMTQVYPNIMYGFVPQDLHVRQNDYVHFQWEGGNTWPTNFWGLGKTGTDRHNIVQVSGPLSNFPATLQSLGNDPTNYMFDQSTRRTFAMAGQDVRNSGPCTSQANLSLLVYGTPGTFGYTSNNYTGATSAMRQQDGNCAWLNRALSVFDFVPPVQFTASGKAYYYMCSRNNFPGRQPQKGAIFVDVV